MTFQHQLHSFGIFTECQYQFSIQVILYSYKFQQYYSKSNFTISKIWKNSTEWKWKEQQIRWKSKQKPQKSRHVCGFRIQQFSRQFHRFDLLDDSWWERRSARSARWISAGLGGPLPRSARCSRRLPPCRKCISVCRPRCSPMINKDIVQKVFFITAWLET